MEYLVYLFCSDESATVMNVPVARLASADITELSDEVMREVYISISKLNRDVIDPAVIANWTPQQVAEELWHQYSYLFDRAAIIPAAHEEKLEKRGDVLLDSMGGDSSCYRAAATFGDMLEDHAVLVIDFPVGSGE